ncbi:MAG: radical SAM protein [candidate division Zixibacteria bacterium]|nr:radical SAM protein [candidate division Zixibacteria bacterium]
MEMVQRKSLLYKTAVEYGDYTINHIEGCAHGCNYPCYAMRMSLRFGRVKSYKEWLKPKLVGNSIELLEKEIPKFKDKIRFVHLCFMSDPFMCGYPEIVKMSLRIIKLLNDNGIRVTTLTKGIYPDDLLNFASNIENEYGITLVSIDAQYQKQYEPFSSKWFQRIRSLETLARSGAKTWVSIEPYPTPNIISQDIDQILQRISFTDKIIFGRLNYNAHSTGYENHVEFYNDLCHQIREFCEKQKIRYYFKKGTLTKPLAILPMSIGLSTSAQRRAVELGRLF